MRRTLLLALVIALAATAVAVRPAPRDAGPARASFDPGPPVAGWRWDPDWLGGNLSLASNAGEHGSGLWIDLPETGDPTGATIRPGLNRLAVARLRAMGVTSFRAPAGFESSWYDWECGMDRARGEALPPACPDAPLSALCDCLPGDKGCSCDRCPPGRRGCYQVIGLNGRPERTYAPHRYPFGSCEMVQVVDAVAGKDASLVLTVSPFAETYDPRPRWGGRAGRDDPARAELVAAKAAGWVKALRGTCGYRGRLAVEIGNEVWDVGGFDQPAYSNARALGEPPKPPSARVPKILPFWYAPDWVADARCRDTASCADLAVADYVRAALAIVRAVRTAEPSIEIGLDSYEVRGATAKLLDRYAGQAARRPDAAGRAPTDVDFLAVHRYFPSPPAAASARGSDALYDLMAVSPSAIFSESVAPVLAAARRVPDFRNARVGLTEYAPGLLSSPPELRHSLAGALYTADVLMGFLDPRPPAGGAGPPPRVFGHFLTLMDWQGKCPDEYDTGAGLLRVRSELVKPAPLEKEGCPRGRPDESYAHRVAVPFVRMPESYAFEVFRLLRDVRAALVEGRLAWKDDAPRIEVGAGAPRYELPRPMSVEAARAMAFRADGKFFLLVLNLDPKRPLVLDVPARAGDLERWELSAPNGDVWANDWGAKSDDAAPVRLRGPSREKLAPNAHGRAEVAFPAASLSLVEVPSKPGHGAPAP